MIFSCLFFRVSGEKLPVFRQNPPPGKRLEFTTIRFFTGKIRSKLQKPFLYWVLDPMEKRLFFSLLYWLMLKTRIFSGSFLMFKSGKRGSRTLSEFGTCPPYPHLVVGTLAKFWNLRVFWLGEEMEEVLLIGIFNRSRVIKWERGEAAVLFWLRKAGAAGR